MVNKAIKSVIFSTAIVLGSIGIANAAVNGPYLGGQVGWGDTHYGDETFGTDHVTTNGVAGRAILGYQFDQTVAHEAGYTQFRNATADDVDGLPGVNGKIKQHDIDLLAKGIVPLQNGFSLNGKLGAAYVSAKDSVTADGETTNGDYHHRILPAFGAGVSYDITPNVPVELSWVHIQKTGSATGIRNSDFIGLGVAYHFGI